jgi:muramoyltetrapeptide carboxypeptidase
MPVTAEPEKVAAGIRLLERCGLKVEAGAHVFDRYGHLVAGKDEDRLADWNEVLRDPGVPHIFTTQGRQRRLSNRA